MKINSEGMEVDCVWFIYFLLFKVYLKSAFGCCIEFLAKKKKSVVPYDAVAELNRTTWVQCTAVCGRKVRESVAKGAQSLQRSTSIPNKQSKPG